MKIPERFHHYDQFVTEAQKLSVTVKHSGSNEVALTVRDADAEHEVVLTPIGVSCDCTLYTMALSKGRYDGHRVVKGGTPTLCVHLEAAIRHAIASGLVSFDHDLARQCDERELTPFQKNLRTALNEYTRKWAEKLVAGYEKENGNYIPLLVGPSDVGKTYIMAETANALNRRLVTISGMPSFADDIAVGIDTRAIKRRGPIAEAFERARDGEDVLLAIDEVRRFPKTVQDMLIAAVQIVPVHHVRMMGLNVNEPVRMLQSPLYGLIWAPARKLYIAMGTNPWGTAFDPAFLRRVHPHQITWDDETVRSFGIGGNVRAFIVHTHKMARETEFGMPIGISVITNMSHPTDIEPLKVYMKRLWLLDPIVAEALHGIAASAMDIQFDRFD